MADTHVWVRIVWRPEPGGSFYQQDWEASSYGRAVLRWRRRWGLTLADVKAMPFCVHGELDTGAALLP